MQTVEGYSVDEKVLKLLRPDESPVFAARPLFATVTPGSHWDATSLLLTDQRMIISKDRMLGKAKEDFEATWSDINQVEGRPGGLGIKILISTPRTPLPIELVIRAEHAVAVESAVRSGILSNPGHPAHHQ